MASHKLSWLHYAASYIAIIEKTTVVMLSRVHTVTLAIASVIIINIILNFGSYVLCIAIYFAQNYVVHVCKTYQLMTQ